MVFKLWCNNFHKMNEPLKSISEKIGEKQSKIKKWKQHDGLFFKAHGMTCVSSNTS